MGRLCRAPLAIGAFALLLSPAPLWAQGTGPRPGAPSLWDLLNPDFIAQRLVQSGIMALRTQVDLKYGALVTDLALGRITLSDLTAWPLLDWDQEGGCTVVADRLVLQSAPSNRPDQLRFKIQAQGLNAPAACFPMPPRQMLSMAGLDSLAVPRLTVDIVYDIASAEADVHAYTQIDGLAALDLTADFSYLWFTAPAETLDPESPEMETQPEPVAFLRRATVTLENLGGFDTLRAMMPPPLADPAQAPAVIDVLLGGMLAGMNTTSLPPAQPQSPEAPSPDASSPDAASPDAAPPSPPPSPPLSPDLSDGQAAFLESVKATWPAFLQNPGRLVLETGFDAENDVFLDVLQYGDDPTLAFDDLMPLLALAPALAREAVPAALLSDVMNNVEGLTADDRLQVGEALLTGLGAPRNVAAGTAILTELAETGNAEAADLLSEALERREPGQSYRWAMLAGAESRTGAASRMDRLERVLPFAQVLEIQNQVVGDVQHPLEALQQIALIRNEAMARLSGLGRLRSYPVAALWAMMGAAAGDSESLDILTQIDERAAMADEAGRAAWSEAEAVAGELAMQAWLGQDLPARFGGQ